MSPKATNSSSTPNGHDKMAKKTHSVQSVVNGAVSDHNTYDEVPYESYPYALTNPYHLNTLATLFGVNAPKVENAKILELGCAAGGNLIPHAVLYPKAHFVGVDLSKVQIDEANKNVKALGLKNIEFHHCSITDIDDSFGKFDYIICHGVISWVPKTVRDKIFEVCNKNLSPNGIAYISYNTLPGWNMVRTIRDMMMYHSSSFANVRDRIAQSRLLLEFVKDSLENSKTPYAEALKTEAELLAKQTDHYLRHDHLEEENAQFYFHEFMNEARKHNLQYLADCNLSTMYLGNMPPKVVEQLKAVNDIVRTEQYMDFITNRRFRTTLLCHSDVKINRNINNDDITKFNIIFNIVPEKPLKEVDLNNASENLKFFLNGNKDSNLTTSSPYMKAILYTFSENLNNPLSFEKITTEANKKLHNTKLNEIKAELLNNAMKLVLQGYISITNQKYRNNPELDKPKTTKMVIHQATHTPSMWVTNLKHEPIGVNFFEKFALRYMDGKHDKKAIIEAVLGHVEKGELTLSKEGQKVENKEEIRKELESLFIPMIKKFSSNALLV
ncbi:class I SAM-dependent methyltransferase [Rickettsia rhipicephali]|uniref:class I SAM-dependent methyltransferase n=1 Tax=Rickettsia rhipicephali TaxID=33992 RepID=UPI00224C8B2E|nr:class I SAM-dependent methyltransferase [Rickettsia rhipicephali]MCX4080100.1 class I SAM-dependent methyltransferase [Rickettsia rhipicephali]